MFGGCASPCYLAAALATASLACGFFSTAQKKAFVATLTPDQRAAFGAIVRRRLWIYACSMAAGAAVAYAALLYGPLRGSGGVCASVAIMMGVAYMAYTLAPKGHFMLEYLTTQPQVLAWLDMYKRMVRLFHGGFALGLAAYALAAWGPAQVKAAAAK